MLRPSIAWMVGACLFSFVSSATQALNRVTELPDRFGRELVESVCTACHRTNQIIRSSGYTAAGWNELTSTMIDLSAIPEEQGQIVSYLAEHFPPNRKRAPTLISGDVEITFKEWFVPTLGQRARDPVEAADGSIWWAGQFGNLVDRV